MQVSVFSPPLKPLLSLDNFLAWKVPRTVANRPLLSVRAFACSEHANPNPPNTPVLCFFRLENSEGRRNNPVLRLELARQTSTGRRDGPPSFLCELFERSVPPHSLGGWDPSPGPWPWLPGTRPKAKGVCSV